MQLNWIRSATETLRDVHLKRVVVFINDFAPPNFLVDSSDFALKLADTPLVPDDTDFCKWND